MRKGFTLIELVIVIAILGILAAIAIPKYVDLTGSAMEASAAAMSGSVKSAWVIYLAEHPGSYPDNTELASNIQGGTATTNGITVTIGGQWCVVPTYQTADCLTKTSAVTGQDVLCVGIITLDPAGNCINPGA